MIAIPLEDDQVLLDQYKPAGYSGCDGPQKNIAREPL